MCANQDFNIINKPYQLTFKNNFLYIGRNLNDSLLSIKLGFGLTRYGSTYSALSNDLTLSFFLISDFFVCRGVTSIEFINTP